MLSVLIPTYNYNTFDLVRELKNQIIKLNFDFEILVLDDASTNEEIINKNQKINTIPNCRFSINAKNLGRSLNINKLVGLSKFENLLIMDCDTFPKDILFINRYYDLIKSSDVKVVFGGIDYQEEKPKDDKMLRWIYGKKREQISLETRLKNPYHHVLTSNLLIKKSVIESFPFPDYITTYGYEDLIFVKNLKENNIPINHIDNSSIHLNLEKSIVFIEKTKVSLNNLKFLSDKNKVNATDLKLLLLYTKLQKCKLTHFTVNVFEILKKILLKNLTSSKPLLPLFDFYRLGYFCKINLK